MHSPYNNPFDARKPQGLPKNYREEFKEEDYEHMSTEEIESYARNLKNTLLGLLDQDPWPAALFDKLEKRHNGLLSMLKKRYAASSVSTNKQDARQRLLKAQEELDAYATTKREEVESMPPKKKQKLPEFIQEVRRSMKEASLKNSSQSTQPVDEEEEPETFEFNVNGK